MSYYIKPKFKIGQTIFSIKKDEIVKIEIESIATYGTSISYLSKNQLFLEDQSFESKEEAEDFLLNSIRLPFLNKVIWEAFLATGLSLRLAFLKMT